MLHIYVGYVLSQDVDTWTSASSSQLLAIEKGFERWFREGTCVATFHFRLLKRHIV